MSTTLRRGVSRFRVLAFVAFLGLTATTALSAAAEGGAVLPPNAEPHGYSLTDMTRAVARFNDSGNDPAYYPDTPFQILYVNRPNHTGSFTVKPGTAFYVPVVNVNDSPPVLGVFPTTPAEARRYLTDPAQLGGHDFKIVVDG